MKLPRNRSLEPESSTLKELSYYYSYCNLAFQRSLAMKKEREDFGHSETAKYFK